MTASDFLKLVKYKPKYVTDPNFDDVQLIEFRRKGDYTASIEFGQTARKDMGGQYFYFEIVHWGGVEDYDIVPLDSDRRKCVAYCWPKSDDDYQNLAEHVNSSLKKLYMKKDNVCL